MAGTEGIQAVYQLGVSCQMGLHRSNNEDNFFFNGMYKPLELADTPYHLPGRAEGRAVLAVCDGMGGDSYGEYAAWVAASGLSALDQEHVAPEQVLACTQQLNEKICREAERRRCRMGSTLVLAVLDGNRAAVYNLGDSRAYLCSGGQLTQLSQDHTVEQSLRSMGVSGANSRSAQQLTQHLGMAQEEFILEPYHTEVTMAPGDRLLLCSDGLTGQLSDQQIAWLLADDAPPDIQALRLTREAEQRGGSDNITALVAAFAP